MLFMALHAFQIRALREQAMGFPWPFSDPDPHYTATIKTEGVDAAVMVATGQHLYPVMGVEKNTVRNISGQLSAVVDSLRSSAVKKLHEVHPRVTPALEGGEVRMAAGAFNSQETRLLSNLSTDTGALEAGLSTLSGDDYRSTTSLLPAMEQCRLVMDGAPKQANSSQRLCVVVADRKLMCKQSDMWSVLEHSDEMNECLEYAGYADMEFVFVLVTSSDEEAQSVLSSPSYSEFIYHLTGCRILHRQEEFTDAHGYLHMRDNYVRSDSCDRFLIVKDKLSSTAFEWVSKLLKVETSIYQHDA